MDRPSDQKTTENLPQSAQEFIKFIIKKMGYRRSVRRDVQAELTAHFEDELRDCTDQQDRQKKTQQLIEQFGDAKLLGILLRRAKKRCRPLWRTVVARTFQTVGVLILCFVIYTVWFLSGRPAITTDYLTGLNRMVRPVADDSQNAAPLFDQAVAVCPNDIFDSVKWLCSQSYADVNDREKEIIADIVQKCSPGLQLITQGVQKPYLWREYKTGKEPNMANPFLDIRVPNLSQFRRLGQVLCCRAQLKASEGQYKDAFEDLITAYKFGRLIRQGEFIVEQLAGIDTEGLAAKNLREIISSYDIDADAIAVLQKGFKAAKASENFTLRLSGERLWMNDIIQRSFTAGGIGDGHLYPERLHFDGGRLHHVGVIVYDDDDFSPSKKIVKTLTNPLAWWDVLNLLLLHPNKYETHRQAHKLYDFYERVAKMTPWQFNNESKYVKCGNRCGCMNIEKQAEKIVEGNILLRSYLYFEGLIRMFYQVKVEADATLAIISIIHYEKEKGQFPDDLKDLVSAGYLEKIPMDPFSDKPLVYKKTSDGFILYSVSSDFEDNGGMLGMNDEGEKEMWSLEGDAVFWPVQK